MRIIAGTARHRLLKSVPDMLTRPTLDRIKESVFNILTPRIPEAEVLDLFAGTGNMGLEALSRGASFAHFVDNRKIASDVILDNITTLGFVSQSKVLLMDYDRALHELARDHKTFDIIFCDPPYNHQLELPSLTIIEQLQLLKPDGVIIVRYQQNTRSR